MIATLILDDIVILKKKTGFAVLLWVVVVSNYAKDNDDYANCKSYFYIASQHCYWVSRFNKGRGFEL